MPDPFLLVTGFGPFEKVTHNSSGDLARWLDRRPDVVGVELETAYGGAADGIDRKLAGLAGLPSALLAMGVHRGGFFRPEQRSGARPPSERPDVRGAAWGQGPRRERHTRFDLQALLQVCEAAGDVPCAISEDAGGYVCDYVYEHVLRRGEELGIPAVFLHVPPLELVSLEVQQPIVECLIDEVWRQVGEPG